MNDTIKKTLTENKFRWKTLTNDETGTRIMVLGLAISDHDDFQNPRFSSYLFNTLFRKIETDREVLTVKMGTILCLGDEETEVTDKPEQNRLISKCGILNAVLEARRKQEVMKKKQSQEYDEAVEADDTKKTVPEIIRKMNQLLEYCEYQVLVK